MSRYVIYALTVPAVVVAAYFAASAEEKLPIVFAADEAKRKAAEVAPFDHTHAKWSKILNESVVLDGAKSHVRYGLLKASPRELETYIHRLSDVTRAEFDKFTESQKLSYLINAYNAFTLTLVINNYPVSSIKKIGSWFSTSWKIKFFKLFGELHALDDIEHEMIRKWFNEPRIHFALVCAARSCPALRDEAYTAERLDQQLADAARNFLQDKDRNYFDASSKTLYLSSIFKWYGDDFNKSHGTARQFVSAFIGGTNEEVKLIADQATALEYLSYDWSLNDAASK